MDIGNLGASVRTVDGVKCQELPLCPEPDTNLDSSDDIINLRTIPGTTCKLPKDKRPTSTERSTTIRPIFTGKEYWRNNALPDQIRLVDDNKGD